MYFASSSVLIRASTSVGVKPETSTLPISGMVMRPSSVTVTFVLRLGS